MLLNVIGFLSPNYTGLFHCVVNPFLERTSPNHFKNSCQVQLSSQNYETGKLFDTVTSSNATMGDVWPLLRMRFGLDMLT